MESLAFFQEFFFRGAKSIVMQIFFVMLNFLLFLGQISGGKSLRGQTASGGRLPAPCGRKPEGARRSKKYFIIVQKDFTFLRGFDRKDTFFETSRNLIPKGCFQMTLNERQSLAGRL